MKSSSGFFGRTSVYVLLIAAAAVFLTPFLWLALSSLKPLDQAMAMPPTLFPRAYYAPIDGARREVIVDGPIARPGIVADVTAGPDAGRRVLLTPADALARASGLRGAHRVAAGWIRVTERNGSAAAADVAPRWDIVPPDAVESRIRFRWSNYPAALAALGGGTEVAGTSEGGVSFWTFLGNTLTICVLGVIGTVLSNAIVAYGFSRLTWRGLRPCTPDGLPVIGAHPRSPRLVFATGHGMLGVTLGPLTGRLVASIVRGAPEHPALARLSPARF